MLAVIVLVAHVALGVAALVLLPHGFAFGELHAWSNTVIPFVALLLAVGALAHRVVRRSERATRFVVAMAAGGWCAAIATGAVLFPQSVTLLRLLPLTGVALLLVALSRAAPRGRALLGFVLGAILGIPLVLAQRSPLPSTRPLGGTPVASPSAHRELSVPCGTETLQLAPLLQFVSRSPDRTWTLLAPTNQALADEPGTIATYRQGDVVQLEATTTLAAPVYSHLNSFTALAFSFDATLTFSPTPAVRMAIEPADYPSGRPMQLAYLDADEIFHVVRARDAEKGPYAERARGSLRRGEPLTIELRPTAAGARGCSVTFSDWSAQVSTAMSPTAGYGVPVNSIQFFSNGRASLILLTLAETGPGRGFDSVGHAAGTYSNRIRVSPLPPAR